MMTIQQIAERLDMTPRAIRLYEEKGLLKPSRGQHNQYRHYSEADAWRLQTIGALRELAMPIEEIKRMLDELDEGHAEDWSAYLNAQRSYLFMRWTELAQLLGGLDALLDKAAGPQGLKLNDLVELAERERRMKTARGAWKDRWNFDALATHFDEQLLAVDGYPITAEEYNHVLHTIAAAVNPRQGELGLDLGTGTGNLAGILLQQGVPMAGVDQSAKMLKLSKTKYPALETKLGNLMAIPYFDNSFDLVVSSFALQHLTSDQKPLALAEINRVLAGNGRVCLADKMFVDERHQAECLKRWKECGDERRLQSASNKHYANRATLLAWFRSQGYVAYAEPLDEELLHMVVAVKRR